MFSIRQPLSLLLIGALLGAACSQPSSTPAPAPEPAELSPEPTDPRGEDDEQEQRREREAWLEQMHRSAPDVDWRAIEERNRQAQVQRRNNLRAAVAQSPNQNQLLAASNSWEEIGSRNQAGHTRCSAVGPDRGGYRYLYIGSAAGGVWRTPFGTEQWEPLSDALFGGTDDVLALAPSQFGDEDIVLSRRGTLLYRSDDGGLIWTSPSGLSGLNEIRRMLTLPDANQTVLVLGRGPTPQGTRLALWASTDQGQSFSLRHAFGADWRGDIWAPQIGNGAGTDVYVLSMDSLRKSTDAGVNFSLLHQVTTGATEGALVGSEAGGPHLYPLLREGSNWNLYSSSNGGLSSSLASTLSGYWGGHRSLMAFSDDATAVIYGGVNGLRSADSGQSFTTINSWGEYYGNPAQKLHADLRGMNSFPNPDQPSQTLAFIHTDGGTYLTLDHGLSVQNQCLDGLGVGQFYDTFTSEEDPRVVVGGTQDQGYQTGFIVPPTDNGPSTPFNQVISGDYGHLCSGGGPNQRVFSTYPGFILMQNNINSGSVTQISFPNNASNLWLPPVQADPTDVLAFYFLGNKLWRYERLAGQWTPSVHSTQDFAAGPGSYLSAMTFAPTDPSRVYATTDSGRLWYSSDGAVTWTESTSTGPGSHYFYGSTIVVDPGDPNHVFVGGSGYSGPGVKESVDGGISWQPAAQGMVNTLTFELAWAVDGSNDVYAATQAGAWVRRSSTGLWEDVMGLGAPHTTYWSVDGVPAMGRMRFGTYGRGIWDLALDGPGIELGVTYCDPADLHSSFIPAVIGAEGSYSAAANNLVLKAEDLPPNQFGYFLASKDAGYVPYPGNSQGILCLGGSLARLSGQIQDSGNNGRFQIQVDLQAIPANPTVAVVAGDTWHFQAWFRDFHVVPTSNFTDARAISFH
ncbi:MAG: hypothetical protein ACI8QC_000047 [Planctomycetota bacterium]|jgi:hypothetical protein